MRFRLLLAGALLLLCACVEEESEGPTTEGAVIEALERNGYADVRLQAAPDIPGSYDFHGVKEGARCEGTIDIVSVGGGRSTSRIYAECEGEE